MSPSVIVGIICILLQFFDCKSAAPKDRLNYFDIELLRFMAEGKPGNVMISPASIKSTLAMILEGAKGKTAEEIIIALRISPEKNDYRHEMKMFVKAFEANNTRLSLQNANALFVSNKHNISKLYQSVAERLYSAEVKKISFTDPKTSALIVNDWVKKKTHESISTVVDEDQITPATEMMIANAIYFKAPWKFGFNPRGTHSDCFYTKGNCRKVSMMILQAELNYGYVENLRSHTLELPYKDERYSMILLVPQDRSAEISQLRDLAFVGLPQIMNSMEPADVVVTLPKFEIEYNEDMIEPLKNMRIKTLFSQSANLTGIFEGGEYTYLSSIYHYVRMKVNEEGIVAAAASSSVVVPLINDQVQLQVNRPFIFFIRDNRLKVILFEGRIEEPTGYVEPNSYQGLPRVPQEAKPVLPTNVPERSSTQTHPKHNPGLPTYPTHYPVYTTDDEITNYYNQSFLNMTGDVRGLFRQEDAHKGVSKNQALPNRQSAQIFFLPGPPRTTTRPPSNLMMFHPVLSNQPKFNRSGTLKTNKISRSTNQEGSDLNDTSADRHHIDMEPSAVLPSRSETHDKRPPNGAFLSQWYRERERGGEMYDYPYDY